MKDDSPLPVVYLRSFKDEELETFVLYRFKNLASSDKTWLAATAPNNGIQEQDALEYFSEDRPYIALGRPGDNFLIGSSKLYASNNEWQDAIRAFFNKSRLVVFRAGIMDSLKWELAEIVHTVMHEKCS